MYLSLCLHIFYLYIIHTDIFRHRLKGKVLGGPDMK